MSARRRVDACVGDDDVQPAEFGNAGVDRRGQRFEVTDVGQAGHTTPSALLDFGGGDAQIGCRGGNVDRDDVGALLGEPLAMAPTCPRPAPVTTTTLPSNPDITAP